jgi:hypothetical protein
MRKGDSRLKQRRQLQHGGSNIRLKVSITRDPRLDQRWRQDIRPNIANSRSSSVAASASGSPETRSSRSSARRNGATDRSVALISVDAPSEVNCCRKIS